MAPRNPDGLESYIRQNFTDVEDLRVLHGLVRKLTGFLEDCLSPQRVDDSLAGPVHSDYGLGGSASFDLKKPPDINPVRFESLP